MKKVLVADDSMFMRKTIIKILKSNGFFVAGEAENGKEALEKYKELTPDIVTLDITMNEMNGLEALKAILEFNPKAVVIMVSALGQEAIIREAIEAGAKDFLVKPFKLDSVARTLKNFT